MSKKKNQAPAWAYDDNPCSKFGIIYADYLKSEKVRQLPPKCFKLLICCMVNASTEKGKECLYNTLKEYYISLGKENDFDLNNDVYSKDKGYFVFPKKQYEEYGFTKPSEVSRYISMLKDEGFIRVVWKRTSPKKPNIYQFVTDWKRKRST